MSQYTEYYELTWKRKVWISRVGAFDILYCKERFDSKDDAKKFYQKNKKMTAAYDWQLTKRNIMEVIRRYQLEVSDAQ